MAIMDRLIGRRQFDCEHQWRTHYAHGRPFLRRCNKCEASAPWGSWVVARPSPTALGTSSARRCDSMVTAPPKPLPIMDTTVHASMSDGQHLALIAYSTSCPYLAVSPPKGDLT